MHRKEVLFRAFFLHILQNIFKSIVADEQKLDFYSKFAL